MWSLWAVAIGFMLDLWWGDPLWMPHPVVAIGRLISLLEGWLRRLFPATPGGERAAGTVLAIVVPALSFGAGAVVLWLCGQVSPWLRLVAETFLCYQIFATRCLAQSGQAVYRCLVPEDLPAARQAVGRIVGRDTASLSAEEVTKATVETIAENTCDGVIAPLIFLLVGGAPLGLCYKAINTMDSMVGYKNDRYLNFGRAPAKLDDLANVLPARLCGLLMVGAAAICRLNGAGAWRIFWRDRRQHASPNSAHTEAPCAGALGVALAGPASYFGQVVEKPFIGDALRPIEAADIWRAISLLYATAGLGMILCGGLRWALLYLL